MVKKEASGRASAETGLSVRLFCFLERCFYGLRDLPDRIEVWPYDGHVLGSQWVWSCEFRKPPRREALVRDANRLLQRRGTYVVLPYCFARSSRPIAKFVFTVGAPDLVDVPDQLPIDPSKDYLPASGSWRSEAVCTGCVYASETRWFGPCPMCGEIRDISVRRVGNAPSSSSDDGVVAITLAEVSGVRPRLSSGLVGLDLLLGDDAEQSGLVRGSTLLVRGVPGTGKSTLLLQIARALDRAKQEVRYFTEEPLSAIKQRGDRLGGTFSRRTQVSRCAQLDDVLDKEDDLPSGAVVFVDSVQSVTAQNTRGDDLEPGSKASNTTVVRELIALAERKQLTLLLSSHCSNDRDLDVYVDVALDLKRDLDALIISCPKKNRFGKSHPEASARLSVTAKGLVELKPTKEKR